LLYDNTTAFNPFKHDSFPETYKTVVFTSNQTVTQGFYEWFTANAQFSFATNPA